MPAPIRLTVVTRSSKLACRNSPTWMESTANIQSLIFLVPSPLLTRGGGDECKMSSRWFDALCIGGTTVTGLFKNRKEMLELDANVLSREAPIESDLLVIAVSCPGSHFLPQLGLLPNTPI